jgi:polyisoprenoid-binding protein YceI
MYRLRFLPVILLLLFLQTAHAQTTWTAYEYSISFRIKNAGITVNGKFTGLRCEIMFSPDKLSTSIIKGSVDAGSLATGIGMRDNSIKGDKYLDAEKYKLIEGSSVKLYTKDNDYAGLFNITIKGVTKEVEIPFQYNPFGDLAEFRGTFTLNRRDFGVGGGSMTMGDNVAITIVIKAKKS